MVEARAKGPARPEAMMHWQRRTLLTMLVTAVALFNANAVLLELTTGRYAWDTRVFLAMAAGFLAQSGLLAVWGGLGRQPLAVRLPAAMGVAATLGLTSAWSESRQRQEESGELWVVHTIVLLVFFQALLLIPARRFWSWQITLTDDGAERESVRFTLRHLLLWITASAGLLALGRWLAPPQEIDLTQIAEMTMKVLLLVVLGTAFSLPLVITSVNLVLGRGRRAAAVAWLVGVAVGIFLAFLSVTCLVRWMRGGSDPVGSVLSKSVELAWLQFVVVVLLLAGLAMIRFCGFRLHQRGIEAAHPAAPDPLAPVGEIRRWPVADRRFVLPVALLSGLIVLLLQPVWNLERDWRRRLRDAAIDTARTQEWREFNMVADRIKGEVVLVDLLAPAGPLEQAALEKLCEPQHAATIRSLRIIGGSLDDEQLQMLTRLTNLRSLSLVYTQFRGTTLAPLQRIDKLARFELTNSGLGDELLKTLPMLESLKFLGIDHTQVTEAGLVHLQALPNLKQVSLQGTQIDEQAAKAFCEQLGRSPSDKPGAKLPRKE